jgi:hypothetical protein
MSPASAFSQATSATRRMFSTRSVSTWGDGGRPGEKAFMTRWTMTALSLPTEERGRVGPGQTQPMGTARLPGRTSG